MLVAAAADLQIGYIIKTLKDIEDAGSPDVFLVFPHQFESPDKFAAVVTERVELSYKAAQEELKTREDLPGAQRALTIFRDLRVAADLRIKEAIRFARSLLPGGGGQRIVFGLMPLEIRDRTATESWRATSQSPTVAHPGSEAFGCF